MINARDLPISWRKSSYSSNNGGDCLEVGEPVHGLTPTLWDKSSHSNADGGGCVEWAPAHIPSGTVPIRDSKDPHGPALLFPARSWRAFIAAVNEGRMSH
ncbi:DUF397 domain-containing protein [Streptomyces netropsis]|uniref:DUF397 domain-containing protein n=1 Tax=Streptomyces netropsis TaxID=55404 RepID=UPI0030CC228E